MGNKPGQDAMASGQRVHTVGDKVDRFFDRYSGLIVTLTCLVFFALIVLIGHRKPIWYDEVFTITVATQPDWNHFIRALPPEGNPPLNVLLVRFFVHLFGPTAFSYRLPPLLGMIGALVGIYVFTKRELGNFYGVLAVALLLGESVWEYAFEARPYGLMLGFLMLALTGWQAAARATELPEDRSRIVALTAMAIGILGCILSHSIGIVEVGVPLLFGEITRSFQRRKVDWPLLATGLIAIPGMMIVIPTVHRTQHAILTRVDFITSPITMAKLIAYSHVIKGTAYLVVNRYFLLLSFLIVLLSFVFRSRTAAKSASRKTDFLSGSHSYIVAAAIGALLLIPITWLAMIKAGGWYFTRYGIGSVIGIACLTCFIFSRNRASRWITMTQIAVAAMSFLASYVLYKPQFPLDPLALRMLANSPSGLPLVIADSFDYPAIWWNAPKSEKPRLFYLKNLPAKTGEGRVIEEALLAEAPYTDAHVTTADAFLQTTDHFWLECRPPQNALLQKIQESGFEAVPIEGMQYTYDVRRKTDAITKLEPDAMVGK